jgi:soluble lytic murein transglycosylase-like protein
VVTGVATINLALTMQASPARAQVLEVQPDGSVSAYAGPVQTVDGVARPIVSSTHAAGAPLALPAGLPRLIQDASDRSQISERLIEAVAWQESRMRQADVSPRGARGVMQLMPGTAAGLGVDARDLRGNLEGGAAYLSSLLREFDGDIILSLAAYNAGPEAVRRWGGVPPYRETRTYVAAVLDRLSQLVSKPEPASR